MIINLNNIEVFPWESWYSCLWKESKNSDVRLEEISNINRPEILVIDYESLPLIVRKTTNVPSHHWYLETNEPRSGFVIVGDGEKYGDKIGKILRSYFSVCLVENEDGLSIGEDVNIFSHTELPFQTFNNVYFQGLQPNPKMYKTIKSARVLISPNENLPRIAIDSAFLGTPFLIPASELNMEMLVGSTHEMCFYENEDDLSEKIKWFSEIDTNSYEYKNLVNFYYEYVSGVFSPKNGLQVIKHWVEKNGSGRVEKD